MNLNMKTICHTMMEDYIDNFFDTLMIFNVYGTVEDDDDDDERFCVSRFCEPIEKSNRLEVTNRMVSDLW
jgi:hypothetical protein